MPSLFTRKLGTAVSLVEFWWKASPNGTESPAALADFVLGYRGVAPIQVRSELHEFGALIQKHRPKVIVEIGTRNGGTLFMFCRLSDPEATIISVDLPGGEFGGGYEFFRIPVLRRMKLPGQSLELLRTDSHRPETREQVKQLLGGGLIDFLFIDGDHTYEGVKQDFEMYSPFVKTGGVVAFHDILPHPIEMNCGVDAFWNEIKAQHKHSEIVEDPRQGWAGIGVLFV